MNRVVKGVLVVLAALLAVVLVGPFLVPIPELEGVQPPEALADGDSEFVTVPFVGTDGIDFHFKRAGEGEPVFLLLHGFASNVYTWEKVMGFFGARGTAVAYDRIPFGLSERLTPEAWRGLNPYGPEATLTQLIAFMDEMGIEEAVLVGNSAGGLLAVRAALAHPERVTGLILAAPAVYTVGGPGFVGALAETPQLKRVGPLIARAFGSSDALLELAYYDTSLITPETRAQAAVGTRVIDWDEAFWQFTAASSGSVDVTAVLDQITVSTLIITGAEDEIVPPADSEKAAAAIPGAELVTIPACGHVPQEECPAAFEDAVETWLDSVEIGD